MGTGDRVSIEDVLAMLADEDRAGLPVASVAATWRFAGIIDPAEVEAWLDVGVFDGHRAGLLKAAGIRPGDLSQLPAHGRYSVGFAYALGELSLEAVLAAVDAPLVPITSTRLKRVGVSRRGGEQAS